MWMFSTSERQQHWSSAVSSGSSKQSRLSMDTCDCDPDPPLPPTIQMSAGDESHTKSPFSLGACVLYS